MKTKFAIGCLVQWYESDIIDEYLDTLEEAIKLYDGDVIVDVCLIKNTDLEKAADFTVKLEQIKKITKAVERFNGNFTIKDTLFTIADYRRWFNDYYCEDVDVLVWGESDMLVPKQSFVVLDHLHTNVKTPKYLATFAICKMWDDSWKPLEHPDFTDKPFIEMDTENWWSLRYTMNGEEMNDINDRAKDLDVNIISPHKYNGCGLVISSEVVKAGVNIPRSVFFIHEDTAFMYMTNKILGLAIFIS